MRRSSIAWGRGLVVLIPLVTTGGAGACADLGVANHAAEVGCPAHQPGDREGPDERTTHHQARKLTAPIGEQREQCSTAEDPERHGRRQRCLLVRFDRVLGDARQVLDTLLRRLSRQERRDGHAGERDGEHEGEARERRVPPDEGDREEEKEPEGPEDGNVIDQKVKVRGTH